MDWNGNGMELAWKIFGRKNWWEMWWKWKGNGMEFFLSKQVENFFDVMEWKCYGIEWKKSIYDY